MRFNLAPAPRRLRAAAARSEFCGRAAPEGGVPRVSWWPAAGVAAAKSGFGGRRHFWFKFPTWLAACLALSVAGFAAFGAESAVPREYQLKAAFLYNFTKFVEWPSSSFSSSSSPIVIGVLGENRFGSELEKIVQDRKFNNRRYQVRVFRTAEEAKAAHLLFIGESDPARLAEIFRGLGHASVLTVGESKRFAQAGGVITFTQEGDKLRFEINLPAAEQAGLKINAQLQKLARSAHP